VVHASHPWYVAIVKARQDVQFQTYKLERREVINIHQKILPLETQMCKMRRRPSGYWVPAKRMIWCARCVLWWTSSCLLQGTEGLQRATEHPTLLSVSTRTQLQAPTQIKHNPHTQPAPSSNSNQTYPAHSTSSKLQLKSDMPRTLNQQYHMLPRSHIYIYIYIYI
jgi:hypothetical protein